MDYSSVFVCLMGMGTVFFGLVCLIVLTSIMGHACGKKQTTVAPVVTTSAPVPEGDRQAIAAAVAAAIAEELGTDITGIRILSMKRV